jgi:hypothetical protein
MAAMARIKYVISMKEDKQKEHKRKNRKERARAPVSLSSIHSTSVASLLARAKAWNK